jgi:hypothetical protein
MENIVPVFAWWTAKTMKNIVPANAWWIAKNSEK